MLLFFFLSHAVLNLDTLPLLCYPSAAIHLQATLVRHLFVCIWLYGKVQSSPLIALWEPFQNKTKAHWGEKMCYWFKLLEANEPVPTEVFKNSQCQIIWESEAVLCPLSVTKSSFKMMMKSLFLWLWRLCFETDLQKLEVSSVMKYFYNQLIYFP